MSLPSSFDAADPPELRCFLEAVVEAGSDLPPRLILADRLDEHDRPHQAELLRLHMALDARLRGQSGEHFLGKGADRQAVKDFHELRADGRLPVKIEPPV